MYQGKVVHLDAIKIVAHEGEFAKVDELWAWAENHLLDVKDDIIENSYGPLYWGVKSGSRYYAGFALKKETTLNPGWTTYLIDEGDYYRFRVGDDYASSLLLAIEELSVLGLLSSGKVVENIEEGETFLYLELKKK